jgi:hypothetical protein
MPDLLAGALSYVGAERRRLVAYVDGADGIDQTIKEIDCNRIFFFLSVDCNRICMAKCRTDVWLGKTAPQGEMGYWAYAGWIGT